MSNRKYKDLTQNTLLFTIGSLGAKFVNLLLVPLYTTVLTTSDYGDVDIVATTSMLLIPILTLDVQDAVLRFAMDSKYDKQNVFSVGIKIVLFSSIALGTTLLIMFLAGVKPLSGKYILFLFVTYITGALNNNFNMYLRAKNLVKLIVVGGIISVLVTGALNLILLLIFRAGIDGYLIGNALGNASSVIFFMIAGKLWRDIRWKQSRHTFNSMVSYSAPLIVNSIAWWITSASNRYAIMLVCGAAANGVFSVAYKIPTILSTIQSVFYNAWSISAISEFDSEDQDGFMGNVYSLYSCATYLACSMIMILNIPLATLLYANDFFEAWRYVPLLLVGTAFNGLALFEGCIYSAAKKTKTVASTTLWGSGLCLIGNVVLVILLGPIGAAISVLLGYFLVWALRTIKLKNIANLKVNWKIQIICTLFLFCQCILATFNTSVFVQIVLLVGICIAQRQYIGKVSKMILDSALGKMKRTHI